MIKENTGKKMLKRLSAFTLSMVVALTTAFFGVPFSAKAAEANTEYTIEIGIDGNCKVSVDGGESSTMSNNGVLLKPGQTVKSTVSSSKEVNNNIKCHHDGSYPTPYMYTLIVGFEISSANAGDSLADLGEVESGKIEIVTGGTVVSGEEQTQIEKGEIEYDKSFKASELVFVEYGGHSSNSTYSVCDCPAKAHWDVYTCHRTSFKVHRISLGTVDINYNTDILGSDNYPKSIDISKDNATCEYEIPTKIGYVFDGWEFTDSEGNILSGVINDSKDGTLTFAGVSGGNWQSINDISKNGITATPKWKQKKLTLNYDPDGGVFSYGVCTVTKENISYETEKDNTNLFPEIKREGYTFDGWYIDSTRITCIADIPDSKGNSSQTYDIKAKWTPGDNPPDYTIDSKTGTLTVNSKDGFPSFDYGRYAKKIIVSEGITEIPDNTFKSFDMEEIELPDTIKTIGSAAFSCCSSLKSITIPEGVTEIKDNCFEVCRKMEEVVLPDSVVSIGTWAFNEVGSYLSNGTGAKIRLSSQLQSIGQYAFYEANIAEINIPDSVTTISDKAFCSAKIASFKMPPNVDKVPKSMFENSTLAEIDLANVTAIEEYAFSGTKITSVTIPDSVTDIGQNAFSRSQLKSVEIPEKVTQLGSGVFRSCEQLESAKLTNGITYIPAYAFRNCTALKKLILPNTIERIEYMAFDGVSIEEVTFAGTEEQWAALCEDAEELMTAKVTYVEPVAPHVHDANLVPEVAASCKATGVKAYYTCTCGKYFEDKDCKTIISNLAAWKTGAGLIAKKKHTLKKTDAKAATCTAAGNKEYWTCSDCKKVYADADGKTETTVAAMTVAATGVLVKGTAFYKVTGSDTKNPTVTYIENKSSKATTVSVPSTVTVEGVTYKVTAIADNAFKGNKKITKVTISKNVKTIGKNAFNGCSNLKTVTIGSNVTSVGENAFKGCKALTKVTLPSKTTKIGANAFNGCSKLKTITIKSNKMTSKTISKNAFKGLSSKATIKVPKGKAKSYKTLFLKRGLSKKVKVK